MTEVIDVLYVEDNPADTRLMKEYLADSFSSCRLHISAGLGEALDFLEKNPVDVILCDLNLTDSRGPNTFRKIHARARMTPIVVLSGLTDEEIALEMVHEGAQDYLVKGRFDADGLARAIRYSLERDRAARALLESEKRYRGVGELVPFGVWTAGTDGGITYLSDVFLEMVGMDMARCKGFGWMASVHPDDVKGLETAWRECIEGETPWDYQYRIRDRFGEYRTVLSRGTPTRNSRAEVISWSGINLDITERRQYEDALSASAQQLNTVVDTTHVLLAYMDPKFNFIWVNRAYAEADGQEPSYFLGKNHFDLYPYGQNEESFENVVRTGEPYYAYARAFEYADHPERGVSYWDWSLVPTKDRDGTVTGLLFSLADVTERVRLEDSLKVSEEKYRLLVETASIVVVVSQDDVVKFINKRVEEFLGYAPADVMDRGITDFIGDGDEERLREHARIWLSGRESAPGVFRFRHKNGDIRHAEVSGTLMVWEGRIALLSFITDITDRVRAEEAVRESEQRYLSLFRNMIDGFSYHEMTFDDEGRPVDYTFLETNEAFEELTGLKDVVGKRVTELIPGIREENPELLETYGRVALSGEPAEIESFVPSLNRWFAISAYSPQKGYFATVFENITERKLAEEAIRQSEETYRAMFEDSLAVMLLIDPDTGNIVDGNDAASRFYGYPHDQLRGMNIADINTLQANEVRQKMERARTETENVFHFKHRLSSGGVRDVEVYSGPITIRGRNLLYSIIHDITEQKKAEDLVLESKLHSEALNRINETLHSSLDVGQIIQRLVSEGAEILGSETAALSLYLAGHWTVAYVNGLPDDMVGSRMSDKEERHAMLALESRRPVAVSDAYTDERVNRAHMKKHGVRAVLVAPLIVRNEPFGVIFFNQHSGPREFSDVQVDFAAQLASTAAIALENSRLYDEQKTAQETIAHSLTEKEALLREIHHRVKNNLQTVSSLLSLAGMSTKNREAEELLRDAESRVHAMALIHSQLYGSDRLDRIDVRKNVRELIDRISSIYAASDHRITYSVEGDDVSLAIHQAIPAALAVNEIVTNAFKYAFAGRSAGTITVAVRREQDTISITISDDGVGLPRDLEAATTDTLGVRLVRNLIEGQLAGTLGFTSSEKGTSIQMSFAVDAGNGVSLRGGEMQDRSSVS